MSKNMNGYWVHEYYGENIVGHDCHIYELKDSTGKTLYRMRNELRPDGSEPEPPIEVFYRKAEAIAGESWSRSRS